MARKLKAIEMIEENSFMGLMASKGQIPGVTGVPVDPELRRTGRLFEVVGTQDEKAGSAFRIVRPTSWGKMSGGNDMNGGAFAH